MRIQPNPESLPAVRPAVSAPSGDNAFATALATLQSSTAETDAARERPLAERWGEYGRGATALGFGPPPDPSEFSDVPVGPDEPASPLNPSGVTTTPAFTVPGYTARGTPIPPGFYNLAYYNRYLREGGTPLEGFPLLADGATIAETYGRFGDGAVRATSFVIAPDSPDDGCEHAGETAATIASGNPPTAPGNVRGPNTERIDPANVPEPRTARSTVPSPAEGPAAARSTTVASPRSTVTDATATADEVPIATRDRGATLRAEIAALLSDLLRVT
jgi:hypothetical protein